MFAVCTEYCAVTPAVSCLPYSQTVALNYILAAAAAPSGPGAAQPLHCFKIHSLFVTA